MDTSNMRFASVVGDLILTHSKLFTNDTAIHLAQAGSASAYHSVSLVISQAALVPFGHWHNLAPHTGLSFGHELRTGHCEPSGQNCTGVLFGSCK